MSVQVLLAWISIGFISYPINMKQTAEPYRPPVDPSSRSRTAAKWLQQQAVLRGACEEAEMRLNLKKISARNRRADSMCLFSSQSVWEIKYFSLS